LCLHIAALMPVGAAGRGAVLAAEAFRRPAIDAKRVLRSASGLSWRLL
jgi:hypothetical protein